MIITDTTNKYKLGKHTKKHRTWQWLQKRCLNIRQSWSIKLYSKSS